MSEAHKIETWVDAQSLAEAANTFLASVQDRKDELGEACRAYFAAKSDEAKARLERPRSYYLTGSLYSDYTRVDDMVYEAKRFCEDILRTVSKSTDGKILLDAKTIARVDRVTPDLIDTQISNYRTAEDASRRAAQHHRDAAKREEGIIAQEKMRLRALDLAKRDKTPDEVKEQIPPSAALVALLIGAIVVLGLTVVMS